MRWPLLAHVVRTVRHYSSVQGTMLAGGVTFMGFLSFFPILALAFAAVGQLSEVYPEAREQLVHAVDQLFPGMVSADGRDHTISLADVQDAAGTALGLGLLGLLYSGLGWVSGMRTALLTTFERPAAQQPGLVAGKVRDLGALLLIGVILLVSLAVTGGVTGLSSLLLDRLGLGQGLDPAVKVLGVVVGLVANTVLFAVLFRLLGETDATRGTVWRGALLGAVALEVLKLLAVVLVGLTEHQAAFRALGVALVLLVWINYVSRVVLYAASWVHTTRGPAGP